MSTGKHNAILTGRWKGKTKKGTPYLALGWKVDDGRPFTQYLYLTDKAKPFTARALKALNMVEGDFCEPEAYTWETDYIPMPPPIRATLTIIEEMYQGGRFLKVKNAQLIEEEKNHV